jgi:hypothetical protein
MTTKYMRKWPTFLAKKEIQIKTTLRFHLTQSEWLSSRKQTTSTTDIGEDGRKGPHTL